ncbi:hypothetical protein MANES_01G097200v8 [Manihot esculenta]|uniref:BHLH domain-containing protein n=1 Tax=Manihot esculenta TaxID=3983 RepID=A0A2C9WKM4_MANES|nr:hypothetical protein MANES_01G097200v8 [Manihot esculenta]
MSSVSKNSKISLRNTPRIRRRRRLPISQRRRRLHARACKAQRSIPNGGRSCPKVSDKLEALKNLIPAHSGEIVKDEQLFQETANYIVLLRTQVLVLQRLIEFYGSSTTEANTNAVL